MKKEMKVIGLSEDSIGSAYNVIITETDGLMRKIPVVIRASEAQQIAIRINGINTSSPLIYSLFKTFIETYEKELLEVLVYSFMEGKFYAQLIMKDEVIECGIGDGICLALEMDKPIYVRENVIDKAGFVIEVEEISQEDVKKNENAKTLSGLKSMMENAIAEEQYELAANLRDRIREMEEGGDKI